MPRASPFVAAHTLIVCASQMTTLTDPDMPFVLSNPRVGSNTAADFLQWVLFLIDNNHLVPGDIFIVDNAAVHNAMEIIDSLTEAFNLVGARMVFLPKYSPELNPCELVFSQVKGHIRRNRVGALWPAIVDAFAEIDQRLVLSEYLHCLRVGMP